MTGVTLGLVGFALLGYFQAHPALLPSGDSLKGQADLLFPHFIAHQLPPVATGIVVSGLLAAAMSSVSSGVNSVTAVLMTDFLGRLRAAGAGAADQVGLARAVAAGIGLVVVALSAAVPHVPGNFLAVANRTSSLLVVPMAIPFLFVLFVRGANGPGVWLGTLASVAAAVGVAYAGVFLGTNSPTGHDPVSFQWIAPVALAAGFMVGLPACRWFSRAPAAAGAGGGPPFPRQSSDIP